MSSSEGKEEMKQVRCVVATRKLIESWISEGEHKLANSDEPDADLDYLRGRVDGFRDCLAILNQPSLLSPSETEELDT